MPIGPAPSTVTTARLTLRPMSEDDACDQRVLTWHTDPRGYELMYEQPYPDAATASARLRSWADRWSSVGVGYWIAERDGVPVGIGGIDPLTFEGRDHLNLYYRLDPSARGQGLAREIAAAGTAYAAEWWPDRPVLARIAPTNAPSVKVARAAGLLDVGARRAPQDPKDQPAPRLLRSPLARVGPVTAGDPAYDELLDLWCRVNDSGGAVGFEAHAPREAVADALERHLADAGTTLVRLHAPTSLGREDSSPTGQLLGFGFVVRPTHHAVRHRCSLMRVMTDPKQRGANLGRLLMGTLHAHARSQGCELVQIDYRGGTGLGAFYQRCGYVETGRVPGGLRFSFGDRDDVAMTRRLDGLPLRQ
ncbi:GNAT family N-acetyltransferase [Allobranchiibius sp. GilTou73]|uniref:GNAT family N-acetyltransferase n=1 Tax=Allobranchiibius sp. GilTou73 TaxID=2904523 RepID=UPI001F4342E6|nr:GNAT family N-acetyltransferase [Allobranchiibius sp. GilTou73]UIJ35387.1 GNAT family N-acetyltransferase [Allobranchiibius sp. GilTou73]